MAVTHPEHQPTPARKIYDSETARRHVMNNLIDRSMPDALRGRKCGDGRDGQNFMEAIFGADLGYAFAAQAALRDMKKIQSGRERESLQTVLNIVSGDGTIFVHTDDHEGHETTFVGGCGANGVARKHMAEFGLTDADFSALDGTLGDLNQQHRLERAVYTGGHIEGAVMRVHGHDHGVRGMDTKNQTSVFVLQMDIIRDRFTDIAKKLAPQYGVSEQELFTKMMERWDGHTGIIGKELAHLPDGTPLPAYDVTFPGGNLKVDLAA